MSFSHSARGRHFNPLPSCEGRPRRSYLIVSDYRISIHSPHARGDVVEPCTKYRWVKFQSTPLMRGETIMRTLQPKTSLFQSTPLMRGETSVFQIHFPLNPISIHSPHARGDPRLGCVRGHREISIHSPHARGDTQRI